MPVTDESNVDIFSLTRFKELSGSELVEYAEPYVNIFNDKIPFDCYDDVFNLLSLFDIEHLVYALEICFILNQNEFAIFLVKFLSHPDMAVCATAYRMLASIQSIDLAVDILNKIQIVPIVNTYSIDATNGNEVMRGSNAYFVNDLKAYFSELSQGKNIVQAPFAGRTIPGRFR